MISALAPAAALAEPLVIAHRGASGYLPEHTLEAYRLAIRQGADFIEPDLVVTKDGHLVARHDIHLSATTDIADRPAFAGRKRRHQGREDWYVADFTLAEIRQLRARQRFPSRGTGQDGVLPIPTFDEVLELLKTAPVGVYPELKAPAFFAAAGQDPGRLLLEALARHGLAEAKSRVFIQCFDLATLRQLRGKTALPLVMLMAGRGLLNPQPDIPLADLAGLVDGIGVSKRLLLLPWSRLMQDAKAHGLLVHLWTFRDDQTPFYFDSPEAELGHYLKQGIDGVFADFPDTAIKARNAL